MKLKSSIIAACIAKILAEDQPKGRKINQTKSMLSIRLGITEQDAKDLVKNYGCYCYPQSSTQVGPAFNYHGDPLDELDSLCKKLYRAQKCIDIDSDEGNFFKPCTTDMAYAYTDDGLGNIVCLDEDSQNDVKAQTRKECKKTMCELEMDFTNRVAELYESGDFVRNEDYYKMGVAAYKLNCKAVIGNGNGSSQNLSCCGEGLSRKTYNPLFTQCCEEQVSSLGSC